MANVSNRALNHEQILAYRCQLRRLADKALSKAKKPPTPDQPEANTAHGPKRPVAPAGGAVVKQVSKPTKSGGVCGLEHSATVVFFSLFEMATEGNTSCRHFTESTR